MTQPWEQDVAVGTRTVTLTCPDGAALGRKCDNRATCFICHDTIRVERAGHYDAIEASWRDAATTLHTRAAALRETLRDAVGEAIAIRDAGDALWDVGNWARMYYETNDRRVATVERLTALAAADPFVSCPYGCDAACMACGTVAGQAHDDDCAWVTARRFLGLSTEGA
jgi:hypothetical protein